MPNSEYEPLRYPSSRMIPYYRLLCSFPQVFSRTVLSPVNYGSILLTRMSGDNYQTLPYLSLTMSWQLYTTGL